MRPIVLSALLLVTAGCLGGVGPGTSTETARPSDHATPSTSPTPSAVACEEAPHETVDPYREEVTPSDHPEPPSAWTESSVREYVVAYEEAYARNRQLREDSTRVTVNAHDVRVERTDDGWVVRLTSQTNTWAQGRSEGTETATVVHGDGAMIPVAYRVTDDRVVRAEGDYETTPDPASGEILECL